MIVGRCRPFHHPVRSSRKKTGDQSITVPRLPRHPPRVKAIEDRWTKALTAAGWTAIPNVVLDKQATLGLKPMDVNIVLQIAKYWWSPGSPPFPSVSTLAAAIGVDARTVQKRISRMVDAGLLERHEQFHPQGGQRSNAYTFQGLIDQCTPFAKEMVAARKKKQIAHQALVRRKTPLHVVKS